MQIKKNTSQASPSYNEAVSLLLREAKRQHRAATGDSPAAALPVLRRILSSNSLPGWSLPELYRRRQTVQRKHVLRTLAAEAGFSSWERYRQALNGLASGQLQHFELAYRDAGHLNCWFSSMAEGQAYAASHGGRLLPVGQQAVVLIDLPAGQDPNAG